MTPTSSLAVDIISSPVTSAAATIIASPVTVTSANTGILIKLGSVSGVDLNALAVTTLFTAPSGITRCDVVFVRMLNLSATSVLTQIQMGFTAGTGWLPITVVSTGITAGALIGGYFYPAANTIETSGAASAVFGIKVTTADGVAQTADFEAFGYLT